MHAPISTRYLLPLRLPRAATSIFVSKGGRAGRDHKFPRVVRTFRGNRRDEPSSRNSPAKRTTVQSAKTNYKQSESFNCGLRIFDCGLQRETIPRWSRTFSGEANATVLFREDFQPVVSPKRKFHVR